MWAPRSAHLILALLFWEIPPKDARWAQLPPDAQPVVLKKMAMEGAGGTQLPTRPRPPYFGKSPILGGFFMLHISISTHDLITIFQISTRVQLYQDLF